jgi:uncharacterized protein with LGFP repeats
MDTRWETKLTDVVGAIREKWLAVGGDAGFGSPIEAERPTFDGVGRAQSFDRGGTISWHPQFGTAFAVYGGIAQKWLSVGREQFGYPVTDEYGCGDGVGRVNKFMSVPSGDPGWIFWTPTTGAREVHGLIALVYERHNFQSGGLGYPVSDEENVPGQPGDRRTRFQGGTIDFTAATGEARVHGNLEDDTVQVPADN